MTFKCWGSREGPIFGERRLCINIPFDLQRTNVAIEPRWGRLFTVLTTPPKQGSGPRGQQFWDSTYAHTVWPRATEFGMITALREGNVWGSITPFQPNGWSPGAKLAPLFNACSHYLKQSITALWPESNYTACW